MGIIFPRYYLLTDPRQTVTLAAMTDTYAIDLTAYSFGSPLRVRTCQNPLELSDAVASEMLRASDPGAITRWLEGQCFYDYWKACFEESGARLPDTPKPRPCLYLDETGNAPVATVLTISALPLGLLCGG